MRCEPQQGEQVTGTSSWAGGAWHTRWRDIAELGRFRDGSSHQNYAVYHDRYQRTPDGWKFTERVYEVRYLDTTPLAGSAPHATGGAR